ncbi:hypothetical protein TNCV_178161 [Trichonephila clavipes]|nr:hypothetical protein TNCV_178161 [Trichonephila clavipes]
MIAASPHSPDEYAMRIATQTESALICKEYSSPFIVSPIPVFPGTTENAFSDGQALKVHTVQGVVQTRPPPCSLLAALKRDIQSSVACVVCLGFLLPLSAVCFFWPVRQCTGRLLGVVPRGGLHY